MRKFENFKKQTFSSASRSNDNQLSFLKVDHIIEINGIIQFMLVMIVVKYGFIQARNCS